MSRYISQSFDSFGLYESPSFILCNPDKSELFSLGMIRERKYMPRFNALGTLSFIADAYVDGQKVEYYDYLEYRRLVYLENIGYFMITGLSTSGDGIHETKTIECESLEVELVTKRISYLEGTYKFFDILDPSDTLMGKILTYLPGWSMGTVLSFELTTKYRTFDISDTTIYNFLMTDVSEAYQCVFYFDTINKTINAYTIDRATIATDVYLSYDNVIKTIDIDEKTEELITALSVYGGGGLSINIVNPLGTPTIYDFSHFKTTQWMSQGLVDAITAWDEKRELRQEEYADLASDLRDSYLILGELEADLAEIEVDLAALETEKSALIAAGSSLTSINAQINAKKAQRTAKKNQIAARNNIIDAIFEDLEEISDDLAFTNSENFTEAQLLELSPFVIGSTYKNDNIIETDLMTSAEIQDQAQSLYNQAIEVLEKVSQPRYEFSISSANFVFMKDFQPFISQLALGAIITIEINEDLITSAAVLLGFDLNYDSPEDFSLIFGNRLRLDDSASALADLLNESFRSSIESRFNSEQWANWNEYKNSVSTFITSALDTSTNKLISGTDQNIVIDQSGIRIRKAIGEDVYAPNQMWMNNGILAFSSDGFETSRLALGEIEVNGQTFYGLVAEAVIGHLIAGNELIISNSHPITGETTFEVTGDMVRITNGYFTLNNAKSIITIDPNAGIRIDKRMPGGTTKRQMYIDLDGNLIFEGDISGASGLFTGRIEATEGYIDGWEIRDNGLWDTTGNYIRSDGKIRLGALWIDGNTGIFSGNFYADNLVGLLQDFQIGSINANVIVSGMLSGINIWGATISWGGTKFNPLGVLYGTDTGAVRMEADSIQLLSRTYGELGASITMQNSPHNTSTIIKSPRVVIGDTFSSSNADIRLNGNIWARGLQGVTGVFPVGDNNIQITEGIVTGTSIDGEVGLLGTIWTLANPVGGTASGIVVNLGGSMPFGVACKITGGIASNVNADSANCATLSLGGGKYLVFGIASTGSWSFSSGGLIYLGAGGGLTQVLPEGEDKIVQVLCVAMSPTRMFFNPSLVQVELLGIVEEEE